MPVPLVSIVVPVFNEQGNVFPCYDAVAAAFAPVAGQYDWEMVFTDNHSSDGTFAELTALAARDPRVRVFRFSRNFGFQRSIYTGLMQARGDVAVQLDCDLQDPPSLIIDFLRHWQAGHAIVFGVRESRQEGRLITATRRMFYRMINWLSEDPLPLDAGDFRLVDRRVLTVLSQIHDESPYLRGTIATLGFSQLGVPYARASRTRGESKFSLKDLFKLAFDGILAQSTVPLRLATYTGLAVTVATFLGIIAYGIGKILFGQDWPAGFATTTTLILLSLGANALFLGIIGEYVGRIYRQVRQRPLTIIEHRIDASEGTKKPAYVLDVAGQRQ
jgi:polyisoprenyl-phosphate glycosyltransferase